MITFLFEQYGYYPTIFSNNIFEIDGWLFELIEVDCSDEYIEEIDNYLFKIREAFSDVGPFIVKTRTNNTVSFYDGKKYILICVKNKIMSIVDLNKFHCLFAEKEKKLDLKKLSLVWQERMNYIETESINYLRIDGIHYEYNLKVVLFSLGLAQNAIQYLNDVVLDYDGTINNLTLTHKKISNLNSLDFFNPFNFVVDYPLRDFAELYKSGYIEFEKMIEFIQYYNLDNKLASVFMARLLYPSNVFDLLDLDENKKSTFKLNVNIEKELIKLKKIYKFIKQKYNVRPIGWLDV